MTELNLQGEWLKGGQTNVNVSTLLEYAKVAVFRVGQNIALPYYLKKRAIRIHIKHDGTQATKADERAEKAIKKILRSEFPEIGFLGEEFGAQGSRRVRWIIDPIDGTDLFIRRIPFWSIMVALEVEGVIVLGVIHNPVTEETYYAQKGRGAFLNGQLLRVSNKRRLDESLILHSGLREFLGWLKKGRWPGFVNFVNAFRAERGIGDYNGFMLIAKGQAELGLHFDLGPEDLAAPKIIIEEAGGEFGDFQNRDSIYNGGAIVGNKQVYREALRVLHGITAAA